MRKITFWLSSLFFISTISYGAAEQQNSIQDTVQNAVSEIAGKLDDATLTTTIVAKYAVDPLLGPFKIDVSTTDGVVKLSGTLESNTQHERAINIASTTEGVSSVDAKELLVEPSQSAVSDMYTTAKIKALLLKNQIFDNAGYNALDIHIETNNGIVFAVGDVKSDDAKNRLLSDIGSVSDVKKVESDIKVV